MLGDAESTFREVLAQVAGDEGFREFIRPEFPLLIWSLDGARLLWASPAAAALREALTRAPDGEVSASFAARVHLRALGQGLAPSRGARLERLRFDANRLVPPLTCACRRISLPTGEDALLTALISPLPKIFRPDTPRSDLPSEVAEKAQSDPSLKTEEKRHRQQAGGEALPVTGTVRFLWRTDAESRFIERSETLAQVVGPAGAAILGRTWDEIDGELVRDPSGAVSGLLKGRSTWSARTVHWRIARTNCAIAVDLGATPVLSVDREFLGFRGFGLCRTDVQAEWGESDRPDVGVAPTGDGGARQGVPAASSAVSRPQQSAAVSRAEQAREPRGLSHLSAEERTAFREIARALGARFEDDEPPPDRNQPTAEIVRVRTREAVHPQTTEILNRLPIGILIHSGEAPLFANRALLELTGYEDLQALAREGGVGRLFQGHSPAVHRDGQGLSPLMLTTGRHGSISVEARLTTVSWEGLPASALVVREIPSSDPTHRLRALELKLQAREARVRELTSILDTATDGVIILDEAGRILSLNRSAEALFGYDQKEVAGESVITLLAPESHGVALEYLESLRGSGVARLLNDGREVFGRVRQGGTIPLFLTIGRTSEAPERPFCAVLRDLTAFKKTEVELLGAKRAADEASVQKSDFLAKVSHEVRTPLNAIIGFAEVMVEERFGPMGNERYKQYVKSIHESGRNVVNIVNDLLDLANIEGGRLELSFTGVSLNDVVANAISTLLQQATRERIVVRTSFASNLPLVVADERSVRQIIVNLVSNAVKFTKAGGQIIISTAMTERGEVVVRIRDTGIGMTDQEMTAALQPFRQLATSSKGGGAGLGLPLSKALAESNRATLHISSTPGEGTLVEVLFPSTRVLVDKAD